MTTALIAGLLFQTATAQDYEYFSNCRNGAYALPDGSKLVISPSRGKDLRYRRMDGSTGRLFLQADSSYLSGPGWANPKDPNIFARFGGCTHDVLDFRQDGNTFSGKRIHFPVIPIRFSGQDASLYGELFLPVNKKPQALVVLHYGSGQESAVYNNFLQYLLPLHDIAVFVYDKPGTGRSTGKQTANFELLATDMMAAIKAVRAQPAVKGIPIGLMGESQGGWIVPLTASKIPVDFLIASYSLLIPPREENRQQILHDLQQQGYSNEAIEQAMQVVAATDQVVRERFNGGLTALDILKARYSQAPWFKSLNGDYTGPILKASRPQLDTLKQLFPEDVNLDYDPLPAFRSVDIPMLWVIAGKDTEAPNGATIDILKKAITTRKNIDLVIFPHADHGMIEVEDTPQGPALLAKQSPGYFELLCDWVKTRQVKKTYGNGEYFGHK
ncbi:alpha/beta hydrolase family protein [Chitinophaga nivalis]|uniref:Alpha/beta hydrolase n=1 Tax=Chitinophaga nivalis TaxID=2991709 RepID=A0ABT3IJ80_9BACT|nr:alpha/beta hydrolase [Chitinophaga nivalis]MCW3466274.1 alpha/beta hydrolase [Chitinophaga nivalis]MCW3484035.1 alpha/beta hydrolase [Chitinophaga nivalis]